MLLCPFSIFSSCRHDCSQIRVPRRPPLPLLLLVFFLEDAEVALARFPLLVLDVVWGLRGLEPTCRRIGAGDDVQVVRHVRAVGVLHLDLLTHAR
jgi:hypothetical protein